MRDDIDSNEDWIDSLLCCPICKSRLHRLQNTYHCSREQCGFHGSRDGNVLHLLPEFLDEQERGEEDYRKRLLENFHAKWGEKLGSQSEKLIVLNQIAYYDFYSQYSFFRDEFVQRSRLDGCGLELGGAAGQASGFIKLFYPDTRVVMTDIAPINMQFAVNLARHMEFTTDCFVSANVECLPFLDKSFDFVFSSGMLHHIGELSQALQQVHAVLKDGGFWYVLNEPAVGAWLRPLVDSAIGPAGRQARLANVRENSYTWQEWRKFFRDAGFDIVQHYWHRNPAHKLESWWRATYYAMISHLPQVMLEWGVPCEINFVLCKV